MGVGQAEPVEHALDAAILAEAAVQRVEDDIGARMRQRVNDGGQVVGHVDGDDLEAGFAQRDDAFAAGRERDLAFR